MAVGEDGGGEEVDLFDGARLRFGGSAGGRLLFVVFVKGGFI